MALLLIFAFVALMCVFLPFLYELVNDLFMWLLPEVSFLASYVFFIALCIATFRTFYNFFCIRDKNGESEDKD